MNRENYEKFLTFAEKGYSKEYIVANERNYPDRGIFTTRVMFKKSLLEEKTKQKFDYPSGVWIDVFVLDEVPKSKIKRNIHKF